MKQYAPLEAFTITFSNLLEAQGFLPHTIFGIQPRTIGLLKDLMGDIKNTGHEVDVAAYASDFCTMVNKPYALPITLSTRIPERDRLLLQDLTKHMEIVQPNSPELSPELATAFVHLVISNTPT